MRSSGAIVSRLPGDILLAVVALALGFQLRLNLPLPFTTELLPDDRLRFFFETWWLPAVAQPITFYFFGLYESRQPAPRLEIARRLVLAVGAQGLLLASAIFLANRTFPRSVLLLYAAVDLLLVGAWRLLVQRFGPAPRRRIAIVGTGPEALELAERLLEHGWHGLETVGHVPAPGDPPAGARSAALGPRLGSVDDVPALLTSGVIDDVVLTSPAHSWQTTLVDRVSLSRPRGSSVLLLPGPFESLIGRMRYRWVRDLPLVDVVRESEWSSVRPAKRAVDLLGAALLLVITGIPLAIAASLVWLTSRGPVFYRQVRVGRGRVPFTLWKLRTMHLDAETDGREHLAEEDDPRLTRVGGFLRRTRLDEIPQLFNVLGGSMSLVGPRPERPGFVERYLAEVPGYAERFVVAPGLTGLAQINGEYHSSAQNKLRYDLAYIANGNLWLDLSILLRTVRTVLTSRGI